MSSTFPKPVLSRFACHGIAGQFLDLLAGQTEAHPAAILLQFLALFGNAIGRNPYVQIGPTKHFLNLFLLLVGPTGSGRKGHSLAEAKRPFLPSQEQWLTDRVMDGIESGQALVWFVRDGQQRGKEFDPGIEDKRLFITEPEFGGILARINSPGSVGRVLQKQLCKAWDSPEVMHSGGKTAPARTTNAHISFAGHITADELRATLANRTDGFANRFLFVWTEKGPALPNGGNIDQHALATIRTTLAERIDAAQCRHAIELSDAAKLLWETVYNAKLYNGPGGVVGALTERGAPYIKRLAAIFTLLDSAECIEPAHLVPALAIWDYCVNSTRFIFQDATGNPTADRILEALESAKGHRMTLDDVRKLLSHKDPQQRQAAIALLQEAGAITVNREPGPGRYATVIQLVSENRVVSMLRAD